MILYKCKSCGCVGSKHFFPTKLIMSGRKCNKCGGSDIIEYEHKTMSTPLTYSELKCGDKWVSFPSDGDDSGHGGFRGAHNLFMKLSETESVNMERGVISSFPKNCKMTVLKVCA